MDPGALTSDKVHLFVLVFVRIITMIALMPVFGSANIIPQIKVGLALMMTVVVFPVIPLPAPQSLPFSWGFFALLIVKEMFVGMLVGLTASFVFAALQFAGRLVDTEMGFAFVELVDPLSDMPVTTMGQLMILLFTLLFLFFNGHYFLLLAVERSFEAVPLGGVAFPGGRVAHHLTAMTSGIFSAGLRLAAPMYVALFVTTLGMAVVVRTVPQINVFFVGIPLQILLGLGVFAVALPMLASTFRQMVDLMMRDIWKLLYLLA